MSDFERREWMEENGVQMGSEWVPFQGKPRSQFCDLRLKDGNDLGPCWPRDLDFVCLADDTEIALVDVTHIRYYEDYVQNEDDEDGEEHEDREDRGSSGDEE